MKSLLSVIVLILCLVMANISFSASAKCQIVEVKGQQMIVECEKSLKKFKKGGKIKVKTVKTAQIEGC